jgi:hypothetical protein
MRRLSLASAALILGATGCAGGPPSPASTASTVEAASAGGLLSLTTCDETCPLVPGTYNAPFHDPFTITIQDQGWQQEPADGSDVVELSRTDDRSERLTFYPGPTGALADVEGMGRLFETTSEVELSEPRTVSIGGAPAVEVDATPTGSQPTSLVLAGNTIEIQPDRAYRFTVAQAPMLEEGAVHLIVTEASKQDLEQFLPLADKILGTLSFI